MKDALQVKGKVKVITYDATGNVKEERHIDNLVVDSGKDFIASRMNGTSDDVMSHMAIGTGSTNPISTDTTLETELDRNAFDSATVTNNDIVFVTTYPAGDGTGSITEAGVFNDATAGTMLCRTVFPVVTKQAGDSMTITWTVSVG